MTRPVGIVFFVALAVGALVAAMPSAAASPTSIWCATRRLARRPSPARRTWSTPRPVRRRWSTWCSRQSWPTWTVCTIAPDPRLEHRAGRRAWRSSLHVGSDVCGGDALHPASVTVDIEPSVDEPHAVDEPGPARDVWVVPFCRPTENPHGEKQPQAPGTGMNEDGFYVFGTLPEDLGEQVRVRVDASGTVFGPFPVGTRIKWVEANGAPPSIRPMGGNNGDGDGAAVAVDFQVRDHGDAQAFYVDEKGVEVTVTCLVPPFPKWEHSAPTGRPLRWAPRRPRSTRTPDRRLRPDCGPLVAGGALPRHHQRASSHATPVEPWIGIEPIAVPIDDPAVLCDRDAAAVIDLGGIHGLLCCLDVARTHHHRAVEARDQGPCVRSVTRHGRNLPHRRRASVPVVNLPVKNTSNWKFPGGARSTKTLDPATRSSSQAERRPPGSTRSPARSPAVHPATPARHRRRTPLHAPPAADPHRARNPAAARSGHAAVERRPGDRVTDATRATMMTRPLDTVHSAADQNTPVVPDRSCRATRRSNSRPTARSIASKRTLTSGRSSTGRAAAPRPSPTGPLLAQRRSRLDTDAQPSWSSSSS